MVDSPPKKFSGSRLTVLLLLVLVLYIPSLKNGYVGWDDDLILNNPQISSLSLQNLSDIFLPAPFQSGSFQPLRTLSHALVYAVSGTSPVGYLALNILLYLINVWLFYLLVRELLRIHQTGWLGERSATVSLMAAAAFAFHPVHVEVVSWLQGGKQTLMAAFIMGSFILYCRYRRSRKPITYWTGVFLFWAGLVTQPGAVFLPLILICYEGLFAQTEDRRKLKWWMWLGVRMLPFVLPVVLLSTHLLFISSVRWLAGPDPSFLSRVFTVPVLWGKYLIKLFLPVNLCCRYPMSVALEAPVAVGLGAALLLGVVAYTVWRAAGSSRIGLLALIWFVAGALPTSGLVRLSTMMADRYLFLPSLGFFLLLALVLDRVMMGFRPTAGRISRALRPAVFLLLVTTAASWAAISVQRQTDWRSALALWSRVIRVYPRHDMGHYNLAYAYQGLKRLDKAIEHYRLAIEVNPHYAHAYNNLGVCLRSRGREKDALAMFARARELEPERSEVWVNLGISYAHLGRDSLALAAFDSSLALGRKATRTAYYNRAQLLFALGRPERATADLETAVRLYPQWMSTDAWLSIGRWLEPLGRVEPAVELMSRGVEQAAFNADCWRMLGNLQIMAARPEEALLSLETAAEMKPDDPKTIVLTGVANQRAGRAHEAVAAYRRALKLIKTDRAQLLNNLGRALVETGSWDEAEGAFKAALKENPDYLEARMNLGFLYMKMDQSQEAAEQLRLVLDLCGENPEYQSIARQVRQALDSLGVR